MFARMNAVPRCGTKGSRRSWIAGLAAAVCIGCLAADGTMPGTGGEAHAREAADPITVRIDNFTFSPATLTVAPGTTVTWLNADDIPHTVTEKNRVFKSRVLDTDDRFSYTFPTAGEVDYFCSLHPHMVGKIIVKAQSSTS